MHEAEGPISMPRPDLGESMTFLISPERSDPVSVKWSVAECRLSVITSCSHGGQDCPA